MSVALFISPHLDDVAFSCGGTLSRLLRGGWTAHLCTIFTASVAAPRGFALRCQTDKGLAPEIDYMQLRRAEDHDCARLLGGAEVTHLAFPEAPHRGYESAAALFGPMRAEDEVCGAVAEELRRLDECWRPQLIFAPQGLGRHVDHVQTIRAVNTAGFARRACWYRDTPYAVRQPGARASQLLPADLREQVVGIDEDFARKVAGCAAYRTQLDFQFGGAEALRTTLREFHQREAARLNANNDASASETAEVLLVPIGTVGSLLRKFQ